jgi:small GTP-binding protein
MVLATRGRTTLDLMRLSKKVCLLGDFAVGKTSLVDRFVYNRFSDRYLATIGVKVSRKAMVVPRGKDVVELSMMLWDLAGSEEFGHLRTHYLRGASGGLLVCDLCRPETLDTLREYAIQLRASNPDIRMILLANKADLIDKRQITPEQINEVASELGLPHFYTSAKTGNSVEEAFRELGRLLVG